MSYLLDTDICSAYLKGDRRVFNRFIQHSGGLHVSVLTIAELYSWVSIADDAGRAKREAILSLALPDLQIIPVDRDIAVLCGQLRASLQKQGIKVATVDLLIACTALMYDLTVATHNQRHFRLVPDLRIED
jgi:tRNA(fMet)-specific endonuclease VapC